MIANLKVCWEIFLKKISNSFQKKVEFGPGIILFWELYIISVQILNLIWYLMGIGCDEGEDVVVSSTRRLDVRFVLTRQYCWYRSYACMYALIWDKSYNDVN